jgi:DNA-binding LacI/PurR family transcriptional regulator
MSRDKVMTLIAAKANVSVRTVQRFLEGQTKPHAIVLEAIQRAAKELKINLKVYKAA